MIPQYLTTTILSALTLFLSSFTQPGPGTPVTGHFILKGSHCAGFNFINDHTVLWTNEIACNDPDTLKVRWLDKSTFVTKTAHRINKDCPPIVEVYKIVAYDGAHLKLKSIWTGWGDFKEELWVLNRKTK